MEFEKISSISFEELNKGRKDLIIKDTGQHNELSLWVKKLTSDQKIADDRGKYK